MSSYVGYVCIKYVALLGVSFILLRYPRLFQKPELCHFIANAIMDNENSGHSVICINYAHCMTAISGAISKADEN